MTQILLKTLNKGRTTIMWPDVNSVTELASGWQKTIRRMILGSFDLEKYMDEFIDSTNYIMKYEGPQTTEPTLRACAHSDQTMMTLLYQMRLMDWRFKTKMLPSRK
ncbi:probable 2-oxoglutarate-dependent dioxygenase AOP1 [Durio zibethinus]|uniref:Probable 2-oxoglutarate-dependent dioxygenase AOP1 n=1 Tax=Durio zibethinus TaxID=66656 RepID=A0A6P6BJ56_DURZI|nr:probable 2-oxoglutarate-dependent dioxygenase AOP1 [Durio zibethinus]